MTAESDWKQYEMMAATIRYGLEILLKVNIFYYAVTGAIVSFYLSRPAPVPWVMRFSLVLPVVMGVAVGVICVRSAFTTKLAESELKAISARLALGAWPSPVGLRDGLIASGALLFLISAALGLRLVQGQTQGRSRGLDPLHLVWVRRVGRIP